MTPAEQIEDSLAKRFWAATSRMSCADRFQVNELIEVCAALWEQNPAQAKKMEHAMSCLWDDQNWMQTLPTPPGEIIATTIGSAHSGDLTPID